MKRKPNGEFVIESNVPPPAGRYTYPLGKMKPGDSFWTEIKGRTLSNAVYAYMRTHPGVKFTIRQERNGYRCWRLT